MLKQLVGVLCSRELPTLEKGRRTERKKKKSINFNDITHGPIRVFTAGNPLPCNLGSTIIRRLPLHLSVRKWREGTIGGKEFYYPLWFSNVKVPLDSALTHVFDCIRIDLGLIPSYHIRHFHHHFLDRLAIIIVLSDQTNKQPASGSIREILGAPTIFVILSTSDPAALLPSPLHSPRDHYDTLILITTLFLTSTAADTPITPLTSPALYTSIVTMILFLPFSRKSLGTWQPPTYNELGLLRRPLLNGLLPII